MRARFHLDLREEVRAVAARLVGASPEDIAFVKNTTEGIAIVANGLDWSPGDVVLVSEAEFPSASLPWIGLRHRGVQVEQLAPAGGTHALTIDAIEERLAASPVRLVCVSWIQYGRGWRVDLADLAAACHRHGALLCVDAIQGLGLVPCDLVGWDVDFAAADGHKWLLAPEGLGVAYIARRHRDRIRPTQLSWSSVEDAYGDGLDFHLLSSARRFEGGAVGGLALDGLRASMNLLLDAGIERIWGHVDELCARAVRRFEAEGFRVFSDRSAGARSGIVSVDVGADADGLSIELASAGIVASARCGGLRVSPHGYNTGSEIDLLATEVARRRAPTLAP